MRKFIIRCDFCEKEIEDYIQFSFEKIQQTGITIAFFKQGKPELNIHQKTFDFCDLLHAISFLQQFIAIGDSKNES